MGNMGKPCPKCKLRTNLAKCPNCGENLVKKDGILDGEKVSDDFVRFD